MGTKIAEPKFQAGQITQPDQAQRMQPVELRSISIEEVRLQASATTQVLKEILVQDYRPRHGRHWGINE
jgi:hypothetical protein